MEDRVPSVQIFQAVERPNWFFLLSERLEWSQIIERPAPVV